MKLALGTVQFGQAYGAFGAGAQVREHEVAACLDAAAAAGIDLLDTARGYGESEEVLGRLGAPRRFRIVTKVPAIGRGGTDAVITSVRASLRALDAERVHAVMLHAAADLLGNHAAALWAALERARSEGLAAKIGVSVYTPEEALAIADRFPIRIIQAPFSAFDQRMRSSGALQRLAEHGCEIHARSIFLQGFALADPARLPPHLAPHRGRLEAFRSAAEAAGTTPLGLALAIARRATGIARIVVGVQSRADLDEILAAWEAPIPDIDPAPFSSDDLALINPAGWATAA